MNRNIKEISNLFKKNHKKKLENIPKLCLSIEAISGKEIFSSKNFIKQELFKYVNSDYKDSLINSPNNNGFQISKDLNKHNLVTDIFIEDEEWYYLSLTIEWHWVIYLSWLLKYYCINPTFDKEKIKLIEIFLKNRWYNKLTKDIAEEELDIEWEDFHSMEYHKRMMTRQYNLSFWENDFYFDWEDWREKIINKTNDLEKYIRLDYQWAFKVKHLLYWESIIIKDENYI